MGSVAIIGNGSGGGSDAAGLPPSNCKNIVIQRGESSNTLRWQDPNDTIIDKQYLCTWAGTKIVRKAGGYPANEDDGTVIVDNTVKNQYLDTGYEDSDIEAGTTYYYRAFPYSVNGVYNYDTKNCFVDAIIYGFAIDKTDSNPDTRVSYIEGCDNENFEAAKMNFGGSFDYGDWENAFFMPRVVMLKSDGTVDYEINPDDYSLKKDGTASDYNNTSYDGNVMVGFPQVWFKFVNNGNRQEVYISNKKADDDFVCYTHYNRLNELIDEIFVGAYDGGVVSSKLRCISGLTPCNTQTGTTEISYATANGTYWYTGVLADYQMIMLLLILMGKTTNTQTKFGYGHYTGGSSASSLIATGTMNTRGLFWGSNGTGVGVKVFGIENFWGNLWKRIAGWVNANGTQKIKMTYGTQDGTSVTGYNTDGTGYISIGLTPSGTSGGYISSSTLNAYGLFPQVASGSDTTYFCDGLWFNNSQNNYALVGGVCADGLLVGAFYSDLNNAVSSSGWCFGASLSCKPAA